MFENKTFETILSEMLTYVEGQNPELDTRTGSIIYTALAPVALELETAYREMDMILNETFVETASKEYLAKHGDQVGVELNLATYAHLEGWFDVEVEIGSRFNYDKFNYSVTDIISYPETESDYYIYELVCETAGVEPNDKFGYLTPITFVDGLSYAELKSMITYGEEEEDTETYRYRIQTHAKSPAIDGNLAQYHEWLDEYPLGGIGKYKVIPCWNGTNTLKILALTPDNTPLSQTKIDEIQTYFDPAVTRIESNIDDPTYEDEVDGYPQGRGMGNGKAPIGAIVTVDTLQAATVNVDVRVVCDEGVDINAIRNNIVSEIEKYLDSTIFNKTKVEYLPIYAAIFATTGVSEIVGLEVEVEHIDDAIDVMDISDDDALLVSNLYNSEYAHLGTCVIE